MNITQSIQSLVNSMSPGQIFGYQDLPSYAQSPTAVIKAMSRLVAESKIERLSKGKFYLPKEGLLGVLKPSDTELVRSVLYKNGCLYGYITGLSLYNKLGLTTQVPNTITIAYKGGRQTKDFGTIKIKTVPANAPIEESNVKLLQYLDVLKDVKKIPDTNINKSLEQMKEYCSDLTSTERKTLISLAIECYGPQVRALVGLLFSSLNQPLSTKLKGSLNPVTSYKLALDDDIWPRKYEWNIE